ncbi:hypothetical protein F4803DRAFT_540181 [Xylaria telfairii]|nr:hypothetical protein F4803DRAFT_540181 [Xylaria telfairii]
MCKFWATTFPCGCSTWRNSGYDYCPKRGSCTTVNLRRFRWKTFCPAARKSLRGRRFSSTTATTTTTTTTRLPSCCDSTTTPCERLCRKCDSSITDPSEGPTIWNCPGHLELISDETVDLEAAEAVFGQAVAHWPIGHRGRYVRRKGDKASTGVWWSY